MEKINFKDDNSIAEYIKSNSFFRYDSLKQLSAKVAELQSMTFECFIQKWSDDEFALE